MERIWNYPSLNIPLKKRERGKHLAQLLQWWLAPMAERREQTNDLLIPACLLSHRHRIHEWSLWYSRRPIRLLQVEIERFKASHHDGKRTDAPDLRTR